MKEMVDFQSEVVEEKSMTFIDEALKNCHSREEFVQAMASVYEYPEVRNNLKDYSK